MRLRKSVRRLGIRLGAALCITSALAAQEAQPLNAEWIFSDEGEAPTTLPEFMWLADGNLLLYDTRKPEPDRTYELLKPETGTRSPAVDKDKALAALQVAIGEDPKLESLPWPESFDSRGRRALYVYHGDLFVLDLETAQVWRVTQTKDEEQEARFSPDGSMLAFARSNDLYVYDIARQKEKRLTQDGSDTVLNGTLSWVYWEEIFARQGSGYWWSEDSGAIAFLRTDESPVSKITFVDFEPAVPRLVEQRYPKAGGSNPLVRLGIIDVRKDAPQTVWLDPSEIPYEYLARATWLPDSHRLAVQTLNREQTRLDLYFMDRASGAIQHVLTETDLAWINLADDLTFLSGGQHFLWSSERDGYRHLYRYSMDGTLVNQITRGDWSIRWSGGLWARRSVQAVDDHEGWLYFTALEKSSVERHLYRIRLDGTGLQCISQEAGVHRVNFHRDAKYYLDEYSNSSQLPALSLLRADGSGRTVLAAPRTELLDGFDLQYPAYFTIPAADGFLMPAQIWKPKDISPGRRYPVLLEVYGGPASPMVIDEWNSRLYLCNILLRQGYIVMRVDNRSATGISKKLEATIYKRMYGDGELEDLLAAVRWLKLQPYVDPERLGIWGWSGGGTFTLEAMTRSKEFKAGIAGAPVTDWRYYDTAWTERSMKRPEDNPQGYEETSLVRRAKDLHGRLLLMHGTFDDNVHLQNTWSFVDELIKAGKMFDMMIYPGRKHGFADRPAQIHRFNKMLDFWKDNL